jgi:hypothetical protein
MSERSGQHEVNTAERLSWVAGRLDGSCRAAASEMRAIVEELRAMRLPNGAYRLLTDLDRLAERLSRASNTAHIAVGLEPSATIAPGNGEED